MSACPCIIWTTVIAAAAAAAVAVHITGLARHVQMKTLTFSLASLGRLSTLAAVHKNCEDTTKDGKYFERGVGEGEDI